MKEKDRELKKDGLKLIYQDEIKKTANIILRMFKSVDEKQTGHISIKDLGKCMNNTSLLTPKEVNIIMRSFKAEEILFEYKNFESILYDVRFELARSRLMDTSLEKLNVLLIQEFMKYDPENTGLISITQIKKALFSSKHTNLTPF